MKEFDLEKAKKGAKVQTRSGKPVRIICWDLKNNSKPIVAATYCSYDSNDELDEICTYTEEGRIFRDGNMVSQEDLMMASIKCKGWINIYKEGDNRRVSGNMIYSSRAEAESFSKHSIATIEIEWEE